MPEIKVIKKKPQAELRLVNNGSPYKRFAVVRVKGKPRQNFRAWYDTFNEAQEQAITLAEDGRFGLYLVIEVQAAAGLDGEFDRKLSDIEYNHIREVIKRNQSCA